MTDRRGENCTEAPLLRDASPLVRLAPAAQRQIDEMQTPHVAGGVRSLLAPEVGDAIRLMSDHVFREQVRAAAAGYELGPLQFDYERSGDSYRMTCTAEWQRV